MHAYPKHKDTWNENQQKSNSYNISPHLKVLIGKFCSKGHGFYRLENY